jgi:hypothetical protein
MDFCVANFLSIRILSYFERLPTFFAPEFRISNKNSHFIDRSIKFDQIGPVSGGFEEKTMSVPGRYKVLQCGVPLPLAIEWSFLKRRGIMTYQAIQRRGKSFGRG